MTERLKTTGNAPWQKAPCGHVEIHLDGQVFEVIGREPHCCETMWCGKPTCLIPLCRENVEARKAAIPPKHTLYLGPPSYMVRCSKRGDHWFVNNPQCCGQVLNPDEAEFAEWQLVE